MRLCQARESRCCLSSKSATLPTIKKGSGIVRTAKRLVGSPIDALHLARRRRRGWLRERVMLHFDIRIDIRILASQGAFPLGVGLDFDIGTHGWC